MNIEETINFYEEHGKCILDSLDWNDICYSPGRLILPKKRKEHILTKLSNKSKNETMRKKVIKMEMLKQLEKQND